MDTKRYSVNNLPETITIGRRTETGVTTIYIDCAEWLDRWPNLTISLWLTFPGSETAYPAVTSMEGSVLVWTVSASDTSVEGKGELEVMGVASGKKKLSAVAKTKILHTTTAATTEPPSVVQTWENKLNDTIAKAETATKEAKEAAEEARDAAENSGSGSGGSGGTGSGGTGADGVSPTIDVSKSGKVTTLTITDVEGKKTATIYDGEDGAKGADGVGIQRIDQTVFTAADKGVNEFTVTLTDGTKKVLQVTNGSKGSSGKDGVGIASCRQATTSNSDNGANIVEIVLTDGTVIPVTIKNGSKGSTGENGVSPTVSTSKSGKVTTLTITDANGTKTAKINDGADGAKGADGTSVTVSSVQESSADGGSNVVTFSDGKTVTVKNGSKGGTGATGATGARGSSVLRVTTAPSSYSTATGGFTPTYRIALSTVLTQSKSADVKVGDTMIYSYYTYPIGYVDSSYVYLGARVSIRGGTGAAGTAGADGKDGADGADGYTPVRGTDYWTEADQEAIIQQVNANAESTIASELAKRGQLKPEFANDISECTDTSKLYVLPDGMIYGYMAYATAGESKPNFTNLMDDPDAYIQDGQRYSLSGKKWSTFTTGDSLVVPIKIQSGTSVLRVRGVEDEPSYSYFYVGSTNQEFTMNVDGVTQSTDANGDMVFTISTSSAQDWYATFVVAKIADKSKVIATLNEEITYTATEGGTAYRWASTGHAFVPADYENRIVDLETGLSVAKEDIESLRITIGSASASANATTAFSTPAYAPVPQQPADGTYDFHGLNVTTAQAHAYMDALAAKHKGYVTKQTMGKDQSGAYDHNRYVLCKSYWRAWLKPNYPMMFAWENGSTVIYSVSASPRVGDTMYTTPYIGTAYSTVTAVNASAANPSTNTPGTPSTRTVNGLVFTRHTAGDVEPTVVYTKVASSLSALNSGDVYDVGFGTVTKVTAYTKEAITCANGIVYTRYPFEDLKADKTKPLSVFVLANEHGHWGDNKVPSISLMRMAKDLCENRENPFLQWLKENAMLTIIPVGNPWGYDPSAGNSGAGYNNSRGVNINRNYDTPGWAGSDNNYGDGTTFGEYPGSEVETQHIMNTMHMCKAKVGLSMHGLGLGQSKTKATEYTEGLMWQGCGYDKSRMTKVAEVLFGDYGQLIGGHTSGDQSYEYCGKSPAYIQYVGAVGGLNEIPDIETGTLDLYTPTVMEAAYTQMLLFLQTWCEEALSKN